jgi:tetratricopeptide (TPR) repeat protein
MTTSKCTLALSAVVAIAASSPPDPAEAARLNNLGVAYMNQQLFEKALTMFEQAAATDSNLKIAKLNLGVALLNLQKLEDAKAVLDKAAKDDPNDAHTWFNLGLYYKNSASSEAALDAFRHVTEIDPNDADTWYFLGATYSQLKKFPEAIAAFQRALKINPLHASAQFGLARAYQQSGQTDPAHEAMKRFQYVTQNKLGAPISLSYGEQGKYSRAEESLLAPQKAPPQTPVKFVDVTREAGIVSKPSDKSPELYDLGSGACFLDYDNDGNIDLLLMNDGASGGTALYHNRGGGKFEEVTESLFAWVIAGPKFGAPRGGTACAIGDYDGDGFADVAYAFPDGTSVLRNDKDGTFDHRLSLFGVGLGPGVTAHEFSQKKAREHAPAGGGVGGVPSAIYTTEPTSVTFIDYDHDGDLDLYITQPSRIQRATEKPNEDATLHRLLWPNDEELASSHNVLWRNNGDGTFTNVTDATGLGGSFRNIAAVGTDFNNDRAVDLLITGGKTPKLFENPREGKFRDRSDLTSSMPSFTNGVAVLDFDHDEWMDFAFTQMGPPALTLWRNNQGKSFEQVPLPKVDWVRAFGVVAIDYDNDGWVDLAAVGETKDGHGEVRLFRNLGPDGWKDVTADVGLDKIQLKEPRAIIAGDYDNDGAVDLLITQNHGPAVLLRNEGGNKNNSLRLALKGLNDNKSAIGTKVEVFSDGIRQKFEVYGSSGYLGQNSPYLTIGLGQAKQADVVRLLWPTGVLQDEIEVAANKVQNITELDRRGSSCPTLFAWDGTHYALIGDMLGAGVIGHWIAAHDGPTGQRVERNIPRPTEAIKIDRAALREKQGKLSFRFMEPLEESVYLDEAKLLAVDHPKDLDVYPNEYFASNPPYPSFKVVFSSINDARPPAGAWDEHAHNVLPDLLAHCYFGDFKVLPFLGFAEPHSLELDLGAPYDGGPLWLLTHGEIEYYSANSMYAADQAGLRPFAPYVEAQVEDGNGTHELGMKSTGTQGKWVRVIDDLGFPAGGPRTMTADLTGKLPLGTRRIRLTTNLQIYWDNILISRTDQNQTARLTPVPLVHAQLGFHGFPLKIEGSPPGNVKYIYEQTSATGPYTRPAGAYTRYGDVLPLVTALDDKFAVFGSGDEIALDFDPATLPALPSGWVRDYFFIANGYEKDMDFYAYRGDTVEPLPFAGMNAYPYTEQSYPADSDRLDYLLEYNTRFMSGSEAHGYSFQYQDRH